MFARVFRGAMSYHWVFRGEPPKKSFLLCGLELLKLCQKINEHVLINHPFVYMIAEFHFLEFMPHLTSKQLPAPQQSASMVVQLTF